MARKRKPPPGLSGDRPQTRRALTPPPSESRTFGAATAIFVPPALVPKTKPLPPPKRSFVKPTAKQKRVEREKREAVTRRTRARLAEVAVVDRRAAALLQASETSAEAATRQTQRSSLPTGRTKQPGFLERLTTPGPRRPGVGSLADLAAAPTKLNRELEGATKDLSERALDDLLSFTRPVVESVNAALSVGATPLTGQGLPIRGRQESAGFLIPPEVAENAAVQLAEIVAGGPYGVWMLANEPGKVWEQTKTQYAQFYGPVFRGDWEEFQANIEKMPLQPLIDVFMILSGGYGVAARVGAVGKTAAVSAAELGNLSKAAALTRAAIFKQRPYILPGVGQVFGRPGRVRYERITTGGRDGVPARVAQVQRMTPQGEFAARVSDRMEQVRARRGGSERRGKKLLREQFETSELRSRAEPLAFARRVSSYRKTLLDSVVDATGISGTGLKGRAARILESDRDQAAAALATAIDRAGIFGGTLRDVVATIDKEIEGRTGTYLQVGGELQAVRIRDLRNARTLIENIEADPSSPLAREFLSDLDETRARANEIQQQLLDAGILNPQTAEAAINRGVRDVELIPAVTHSPGRAQFEDAMYTRWEGLEDVDERVSTALALTDAAALSASRRTGVDAGEWYDDTFRKVVAEEVPEGALEQIANFEYSPEPEKAAANVRAKLNPRSQAKGKHGNRSIRRKGIVVVGPVTPKDWVGRVERAYPEDDDKVLMGNWYATFEPLFRETFGADADTVMRGFAVSQANASPTFGVEATLKVLDKVRRGETVKPREISVVVKGIESALKGEPIRKGMAAKLRDFSDSLAGKTTRSHMGDDPNGGPPVAVDVHALRDLGYIDPKLAKKLEAEWGLVAGRDYQFDSTGSASGPLYERAAEQYVAITEHLNEVGFAGRTDWLPHQTQALGWATVQKLMGVDPEDLGYALGRNTRSIDFELTGGPENLGADLTVTQIQAIGREMEASARDLVESQEGVWLRGITHSIDGWGGMTSPAMHVRVIGSREQVQALVTRFAQAFRQGLVQASREVSRATARAAVVISSPSFTDMGTKAAFFQRLNEIEPRLEGFVSDVVGDNPAMTIRTRTSSVSKNKANAFLERYRKAVAQVETEMGIEVDLGAKNIELLIGDQYGEASRTATAGRDRWGNGGVDDPVARAVGERLLEAITRAGADSGDAPRVTPRILTRDEAWTQPPREGYVYHGTTPGAAESILAERRVAVGERSEPAAAWFSSDPALAAFHGDTVLEFPKSVLPDGTQTHPLGAISSTTAVLFQRHPDAETIARIAALERFLEPLIANVYRFLREDSPTTSLDRDRRPRRIATEVDKAKTHAIGVGDPIDPSTLLPVRAREGRKVDRERAEDMLYRRAKASENENLQQIASAFDELDALKGEVLQAAEVRAFGEPLGQWDYARFYDTEPRGPRGGALVREDGTDIFLGPDADLTTVVHEAAHAILPEGLGWLTEFDPDWANDVADVLRIKEDGVITDVSQEIFAYTVESWAAMGKPTAVQLRERFQSFQKESRAVYGGTVKVPQVHRLAVKNALESKAFMDWVTDLYDPLWGMRAGEGAFFIQRRAPLTRDPFLTMRGKSGLTKSRDRVRESQGILFEEARDITGPEAIVAYGERWQRHIEQNVKIAEIMQQELHHPIPIVDGFYDFDAVPAGYEIFNPDGVRNWVRAQSEVNARDDGPEPTIALEEIIDGDVYEVAEAHHKASMLLANEVYPKVSAALADVSKGRLYMIPAWVKEQHVRNMSGSALNRDVLERGATFVLDTFKTLNALQRLRMYIALRYPVLNIAATLTLNTMNQGIFMPMNLGAAIRILRNNPKLAARLETEVGSGFYESLEPGALSKGAGRLAESVEATAQAVGHAISRPEAILRLTSLIHHLRRSGARSEQQMLDLLDSAGTNVDARAHLSQIGRWAEEDVVRFRGFPQKEKDILRSIFFVSGWLMSASRFALRYPGNHPFYTTMLAQLGDDGWEEMRRRMAEWTQSTKYSIEVTSGTRNGQAYTGQVDANQLLPFSTGFDIGESTLGALGRLVGMDTGSEKRMLESLAAAGRFGYAMLAGETIYGEPYTWQTLLDDFLINGTPLDYLADVYPRAFKWVGHERTPGKTRVDQTFEEYMQEWAGGRLQPTRYKVEKIKEQYAKQHEESGGRAAQESKEWADKVEAFTGSPPSEQAMSAKTAQEEWTRVWAARRAELDDDRALGEEEKLLEIAKIKVATMKKYGLIPPEMEFRGDSVATVYALVEANWEARVEALSQAYPLP